MERAKFKRKIDDAFAVNPAVALLGPRQCGKTTLAREYAGRNTGEIHLFDLENPLHLERLASPMLALEKLKGLVVIDEIQRRPDLFPVLRVLIDADRNERKFLVLGSASRALIQQSSESLAGRLSYIELTPLQANETKETQTLWERGGFPRSYLAHDSASSYHWRTEYIRTFLEQDIPNLGIKIPATHLRRFWAMLSHYHGNIVNYSELGKSLDLAHTTIKRYVDLLHDTFMIRLLQPWFENISKRQVKSPKVYFRDSGIFHTMLGIEGNSALSMHPKFGASWEGFALEEIIRNEKSDREFFFWASHSHAELDLLVVKGEQRTGFEFKYTDVPKKTKSLAICIEDLKLDRLVVIFPGTDRFPLDPTGKIEACGLDLYLQQVMK